MKSRRLGESGGGVLSFTFLDVLTCTMGSLILLVVILGEKAKNTRLEDALRNGTGRATPTAANAVEVPSPMAGAKATAAQLAELRRRQAQLEQLRTKAAERIDGEKSRVSHLEDHERRLEHDLAKLHIALERLEAVEQKQRVDQVTAERELERLRQVLKDTEDQVQNLRGMGGSKKSYAIVPYKGVSGTFRRPIYIECTQEAVIIQPDGIRLTAVDFDGPIRSGNPLTAAIRAAREELNARAAAAGAADLPDPYPLLIVRPEGAQAYAAVLSAINSWDADYGSEFVAADWKLQYPELDPRLSQVMIHAVEQARQRQAMLAKVAPRRYASRLSSAGGPGGGGLGGGARGAGEGSGRLNVSDDAGAVERIGEGGSDGFISSTGEGFTHSGGDHPKARRNTSNRYGASAHDGGTAGQEGRFADEFKAIDGQSSSGATSNIAGASGSTGAGAPGGASPLAGPSGGNQAAGTPSGTSRDNPSATGGTGGPTASGSASGGTASGGSVAAGGATPAPTSGGAQIAASSPGMQVDATHDARSAAETRGANWANAAASRRASPITRPIHVVVRTDRLDVLPDAASLDAAIDQGTAVSFDQPTDKVLDELAAAVQNRLQEWGLAGQGMYWRPTLTLRVASGADRHAIRLKDLLKDSGLDVQFHDVTAQAQKEPARATR